MAGPQGSIVKGTFDQNIANLQIADDLAVAGSKTMRWVSMDTSKNDATTVSNSKTLNKEDIQKYAQAAKEGKGAQGGSGFYFQDPINGKVVKADTITGTYRLNEIGQKVTNIVSSTMGGLKIVEKGTVAVKQFGRIIAGG